ncbi:MAG: hypothetical protein KDC92_11345 [Bacteroidetes bacterium]|nr:hypothetical protein [Bacteroidota bacterium]
MKKRTYNHRGEEFTPEYQQRHGAIERRFLNGEINLAEMEMMKAEVNEDIARIRRLRAIRK